MVGRSTKFGIDLLNQELKNKAGWLKDILQKQAIYEKENYSTLEDISIFVDSMKDMIK